MRFSLSLLAFLLGLAVLSGCEALEADAQEYRADRGPLERQHLIILHTNDIHGQVVPVTVAPEEGRDFASKAGGLERVAKYIHQVRAEAREAGSDVLVVDAGDWFQGTPEGAEGRGRDFLTILAKIGFDAVCVGNHEFDHGIAVLVDHLDAVQLPALLTNVTYPSGRQLEGTAPFLVLQRAGSRIALVGLLTRDTPKITHPSASTLHWNDELKSLNHWEWELADASDWVLPLTHLGIKGDRMLADAKPNLPLIIGGHSHTLLPEGEQRGNTLIAQAGAKGMAVGRIDVWIDPRTRKPIEMRSSVRMLFDENATGLGPPGMETDCRRLLQKTAATMDVTIARSNGPLRRSRKLWESSQLGNWVADTMRRGAPHAVSFQNRGGIRADWAGGPITRRDLYSVLPFDNYLVTLKMSGAELEQFFRTRIEGAEPQVLEVSGMQIFVQPAGDRWRLEKILVLGEDLDPSGEYTVITNNFLAAGGDGFDELTLISERHQGDVLQRELAEDALKQDKVIQGTAENRYHVSAK